MWQARFVRQRRDKETSGRSFETDLLALLGATQNLAEKVAVMVKVPLTIQKIAKIVFEGSVDHWEIFIAHLMTGETEKISYYRRFVKRLEEMKKVKR